MLWLTTRFFYTEFKPRVLSRSFDNLCVCVRACVCVCQCDRVCVCVLKKT